MVMAIISDCGTRLHPAMDYTYLTMVDALPNLVFIQLLLLFRVARVQMLLCSPFPSPTRRCSRGGSLEVNDIGREISCSLKKDGRALRAFVSWGL